MSGNQDEQYKFSTTGYSVKSIYGKGTDSRGHRTQLRLNLSPALHNTIALNHKDWGYRSMDEFLRDSAVHRIKFWQDNPPDDKDHQDYMALLWVEELEAQFQEYERAIQQFREVLNKSRNSETITLQILERVRVYMDSIPEGFEDYFNELLTLIKQYTPRT